MSTRARSSAWSSCLVFALSAAHAIALAQPTPAGGGAGTPDLAAPPPSSPTPSASSPPPATSPTPAATGQSANTAGEPAPVPPAEPPALAEPAPSVPPPPPQAPVVPPAPIYPQPAPAAPGEPGYYGTYPPPPEYAAPPTTRYTPQLAARDHDGFFLRFNAGVAGGFTQYHESVNGRTVSYVKTRGVAALFGFSAGGRVVGNFILHGDFAFTNVYDAAKEVGGRARDQRRIDGSTWLLGLGGTYYFMPANVYVTGTAGVAGVAEYRDYTLAFSSGAGFGSSAMIGKEWWVGGAGQWGIGGAVRGGYIWAPVDIGPTSTHVQAEEIGLVFSATYN